MTILHVSYLETGDTYGHLRPWVWIAWLFFGPVFGSLATNWYLYVSTIARVRMEAIITQLVFEHSLKIRMKAEASSEGEKSESTSSSGTNTATSSKATSIIGADNSDGEESRDESRRSENGTSATDSTVIGVSRSLSEGTQTTLKGKAKDKKGTSASLPPKKKNSDENLLGRINNYVTTDLQNLLQGIHFLDLGVYSCFIRI